MIKIDLITGFLGSGKTTFMKKYVSYLTSQGNKVGIIENDFGAINIDMLILQDMVSEKCEIEQIVGGSVVSDWKRRFKAKLISMAMCGYNRILVEPSGIFDVDAFFDMLYDEPLDRWYEVGNVFAIVDAQLEKELSKQSQYLLVSQIANAGKVVLSKSQDASDEQINDTKDRLQKYLADFKCNRQLDNDIADSVWDNISLDEWKTLSECGWKKADHEKMWFDQKEVFQSMFIMEKQMPEYELKKVSNEILMDADYGKVFRVKGFMNLGDEENPDWIELNATKEKMSIIHREKGQNVLIIIGEKLDNEKIEQRFGIS